MDSDTKKNFYNHLDQYRKYYSIEFSRPLGRNRVHIQLLFVNYQTRKIQFRKLSKIFDNIPVDLNALTLDCDLTSCITKFLCINYADVNEKFEFLFTKDDFEYLIHKYEL